MLNAMAQFPALYLRHIPSATFLSNTNFGSLVHFHQSFLAKIGKYMYTCRSTYVLSSHTNYMLDTRVKIADMSICFRKLARHYDRVCRSASTPHSPKLPWIANSYMTTLEGCGLLPPLPSRGPQQNGHYRSLRVS